jgi:hypothetical protein
VSKKFFKIKLLKHTLSFLSDLGIEPQCRKWREQHNPNKQQLADIIQLEKTIKELETVNAQVLNLAGHLKKGTIDRIFEKSDIELAFDFFTQNINRE